MCLMRGVILVNFCSLTTHVQRTSEDRLDQMLSCDTPPMIWWWDSTLNEWERRGSCTLASWELFSFLLDPTFANLYFRWLYLIWLSTQYLHSSFHHELPRRWNSALAGRVGVCAFFFALILLQFFFRQISIFRFSVLILIMRKATTSLLYNKVFSLSQRSLAQATTGKTINLSSGDMPILEKALMYGPFVLVAPMLVLLFFGFIFWTVSSALN